MQGSLGKVNIITRATLLPTPIIISLTGPVEGCHEDPDPGDGAAELGLPPHPLREGEEQHEQRGHVGQAVHQHHPVNQLPILRIAATFHTCFHRIIGDFNTVLSINL